MSFTPLYDEYLKAITDPAKKTLELSTAEVKSLLEACASAGKFWRGVARRDMVVWEDKQKDFFKSKSDSFDALCLRLERLK